MMSAPSTLLQAAMHRLVARMGSALADTAAGLAVLAQDAPARVQQEFTLFWQEVEMEAERLERGDGEMGEPAAERRQRREPVGPPPDPQEQIDQLRARVAELARRLESPLP